MRRFFGGLPPRYPELLRLTLFVALLRLVPLLPGVLAYFLLPVGSWLRLILLLCPVLWVWIVCPARVRYGGIMAAFAKDASAPLSRRIRPAGFAPWKGVCVDRAKKMRRYALPLLVLLAVLLLLFFCFHVFSALRILLGVFGAVATALGVVAAVLPRLLMGEAVVQQAGPLGGMGVLAFTLGVCLFLFGRGAFRTSAYRFGFTGLPKPDEMKPLRRQNLRLWLPTLVLFAVSLIVSYRELGLLFANFLGAAPLFAVKLHVPQILLLSLTAISYLLLVPIRKYNTAAWAVKRGGINEELGMRN